MLNEIKIYSLVKLRNINGLVGFMIRAINTKQIL